jgi:nucleotide-binding universal stress UspA family protein
MQYRRAVYIPPCKIIIMVSRILVPHDGSEASDNALAKATELAKALRSEIVIVHIVDSRFVPPSATLGFISDRTSLEGAKAELVRILKSGAEQMLKEKMARVKSEGINVDFMLGVGSPADEIVRIARSIQCDFIVMGSRQATLKEEKMIMLGSVARKVSETAHCPVMIVR